MKRLWCRWLGHSLKAGVPFSVTLNGVSGMACESVCSRCDYTVLDIRWEGNQEPWTRIFVPSVNGPVYTTNGLFNSPQHTYSTEGTPE